MKQRFGVLKSSAANKKPTHLYHTTSETELTGPLIESNFPTCVSSRGDFPTSLARQIYYHPLKSPKHKRPSTRKSFELTKVPSFLKSPRTPEKGTGSASATAPQSNEYSGYASPRTGKTVRVTALIARCYTSARKLARHHSNSSRRSILNMRSLRDLEGGKAFKRSVQKPKQQESKIEKPFSTNNPASNPIRQYFYRPTPTGPNSIYFYKTDDQPSRSKTTSMQLVARKLL